MVNDGICKRVAELKEAQSHKCELSRDQVPERFQHGADDELMELLKELRGGG
jgi:hypothetical protein